MKGEELTEPHADWHAKSWRGFLKQKLPELLAGVCTVTAYSVEERGQTCDLAIGFGCGGRGGGGDAPGPRDIEVTYSGIPLPDDAGIFRFEGRPVVLVPEAETEALQEVWCGGELAREYLESRVGSAGEGALRDESAVRSWLPLDEWIRGFFREKAQVLDTQNWLSRATHLRRIRIRSVGEVAPAGQAGLACPFETPEGPNVDRVLTVARGAAVRGGRVVSISERPGDDLGVGGSMIPFVEYSDPARLLMGANMMRQWIPALNPEPALVRTGCEPQDPEFWCGFNLLTAFVSMGRRTFEDAIVLSESAVGRMRYRDSIGIGDKFSNRHGTKGVVGAILPDDAMPRLAGGTPVECVFSFIGLHTRMNAGQLLEALYSRLVERKKAHGLVPPFAAPSRQRLTELLEDSGLPEHGMERLTLPSGAEAGPDRAAGESRGAGRPAFPSTVGWVYWGRTVHTAAAKVKTSARPEPSCQLQGVMEYYALRDAGALAVIAERNGVTAVGAAGAEKLQERITAGAEPKPAAGGAPKPAAEAAPRTAAFRHLSEQLRRGGISLRLRTGGLGCEFLEGEGMELAMPVPHPWRSSVRLERLPEPPAGAEEFEAVREANRRLKKLIDCGAPESLVGSAHSLLRERIMGYFGGLIRPIDVLVRGRLDYSARSVLVPGSAVSIEELGLPDDIAWALYTPFVAREAGRTEAAARGREAAGILDRIMSESVVLLNRAPTLSETGILAFRPVRVAHRAIELHPLVCRWMNADFDGDQAAVFLLVTDEAVRDAREKLTVVGHVRRDPRLLDTLLPTHEALWGLAWLSRQDTGRGRIAEVLGHVPAMPDGILTAPVLRGALQSVLRRKGPGRAVETAESLMDLGLEAAGRSGASFNVFMRIADEPGPDVEPKRSNRSTPPIPLSRREAQEAFASSTAYGDVFFGPQLIAVKSGARGGIENLLELNHSRAIEPRGAGAPLLAGMGRDEFHEVCRRMRRHLHQVQEDLLGLADEYDRTRAPQGYALMARAARAEKPGIVFASAAATGEIDPLMDLDARLFVGLPPDAADSE